MPVEIPDIQHLVDVELKTVQVSWHPVKTPDTQHAVDADLRPVLGVSRLTLRLFKPSQLGLWKRLVTSSYFQSSSFIRDLGKIKLKLSWHTF